MSEPTGIDSLAEVEVTGLDLVRLAAFLDREFPGFRTGPLRATVIAGGRSNLTYEVTDASRSWIVRRPPLGHVLTTAHDMTREHTVMTALQGSGIPVPRTYALCEDSEVIGAPFYIMERVSGIPYYRAAELMALGPVRTRKIATNLVETLARLHDIDPESVGLSGFGRPKGFLGRQVDRWGRQLDASQSRSLKGVDALRRHLMDNLPAKESSGIVHGDYRLDNLLHDDRDEVTALLDWEMSTIGEPLTDLALLVVSGRIAALDSGYMADASNAPGFLTEAEIFDTYARTRGRQIPSDMNFYLGLAYFKVAVILEGIHFRYIKGLTIGSGFENVGQMVEPLIAAGLSSIKENDHGF